MWRTLTCTQTSAPRQGGDSTYVQSAEVLAHTHAHELKVFAGWLQLPALPRPLYVTIRSKLNAGVAACAPALCCCFAGVASHGPTPQAPCDIQGWRLRVCRYGGDDPVSRCVGVSNKHCCSACECVEGMQFPSWCRGRALHVKRACTSRWRSAVHRPSLLARTLLPLLSVLASVCCCVRAHLITFVLFDLVLVLGHTPFASLKLLQAWAMCCASPT